MSDKSRGGFKEEAPFIFAETGRLSVGAQVPLRFFFKNVFAPPIENSWIQPWSPCSDNYSLRPENTYWM